MAKENTMGTIDTLETYVKNKLLPTVLIFAQYRWVQLLLAFIAGIIAMSIWDNYSTKLAVERQLRKIDSLTVEINHMNTDYLKLKSKADSLDVELVEANLERDRLKGNFGSFKRPKIDNASEAYKFLKEFSKDGE